MRHHAGLLSVAVLCVVLTEPPTPPAHGANFTSSNRPWAKAEPKRSGEFTDLKAIKLRVGAFRGVQMRYRLVTVLRSGRSEMDPFMCQDWRKGLRFFSAGWYADLGPMLNDPTASR